MQLLTVGGQFQAGHIYERLNEIVTNLDFQNYKSLDTHGVSIDNLKMIGFDPNEYIDSVLKTNEVNITNYDINIILTVAPLEGGRRVVVFPEKKVVLVSCNGIRTNENDIAACSALVYSAYIAYSYEEIRESKHPTECVFNLRTFVTTVTTGVCEGCRHVLADTSENPGYIVHRIFRKDHPHYDTHVILQHGVRTHAKWTMDVSAALEKSGFQYTTFHYGYFSLLKLYFNEFFGRKIKNKFISEYGSVRAANPTRKISVIAHSYGALLVCQAIAECEEIKLDKIVMVGSIVPRDFNWHKVLVKKQVELVLNECGKWDVWPVIASKLIKYAGNAGAFYFSVDNSRVRNVRYKGCFHSTLLNANHCREVWEPFLEEETITPSGDITNPGWLLHLLDRLPALAYWVIIAGFIVGIVKCMPTWLKLAYAKLQHLLMILCG